MEFKYHDIRQDFDIIKQEHLAPYVTQTWLSDRLSEAPPTNRIRNFFDRRRPPEMSQTAQAALLLCGYLHEQALRTLREGVPRQADLTLVVKEASKYMRGALDQFYKIQHPDDLNHCLTDFESLMKTACLFLSMYESRVGWAAQCFRVLKSRKMYIEKVKEIPIQDDLGDADKVLRLVMSGCEKAMERIQRKERCSARESIKKGKERRGTTRRSAQKEPLEVLSVEGGPPQRPNIHPFPVETNDSYNSWSASVVPSLDYEPSSPLGEYYVTSSPAYTTTVYESSAPSPVAPQFAGPNINIATKRRLSGEDDSEFQRPLQRRRESSPSLFWAQEQSLTQNDAPNLPLMTAITPPTPHFDPSTLHYIALMSSKFPDYSIWDQGEELVDLTPRDGFNSTDYQTSFYHLH